MLSKLMAIFIGVPLIEMLILIKLGEALGFWVTVLLVVGTGALGACMARMEGLRAWQDIQRSLAEGKMPGSRALDALLILAAGIVLITPGLLTDLTGFALLIPPLRKPIKVWILKQLQKKMDGGSFTTIQMEP